MILVAQCLAAGRSLHFACVGVAAAGGVCLEHGHRRPGPSGRTADRQRRGALDVRPRCRRTSQSAAPLSAATWTATSLDGDPRRSASRARGTAIADLAANDRQVPTGYAAKVSELVRPLRSQPGIDRGAGVAGEPLAGRAPLSPVGARGLAQLMPGTARAMLGVDPADPVRQPRRRRALPARAARPLRRRSWRKALAAYNAGPGRV